MPGGGVTIGDPARIRSECPGENSSVCTCLSHVCSLLVMSSSKEASVKRSQVPGGGVTILSDDAATDTVMLYVILNKRKLVAIQYYHVYSMGSSSTPHNRK